MPGKVPPASEGPFDTKATPPMTACSIDDCASLSFCRGWCSKHYSRWQRHGDPLSISRRSPAPGDAIEVWCPGCSQMKHVRYFGQRSAQATSRRKGYCRECESDYLTARRADASHRQAHREASAKYARSERARELRLIKLYGITTADHAAMLASQGGRCGVCRTDQPGGQAGQWPVDHDHTTGRVRGLLCTTCNLALGYMADDPARLRAAADYLERTSAPQAA